MVIQSYWNEYCNKRSKQEEEPILLFATHINDDTILGDGVHSDHPIAFHAL